MTTENVLIYVQSGLFEFMTQNLSSRLGEVATYAIELGDNIESIYGEGWSGLKIERQGNILILEPSNSIDRLRLSFSFRISTLLEISEDDIKREMKEIPGEVTAGEVKRTLQKKRLEQIDQDAIDSSVSMIEDTANSVDSHINKLYFQDQGELFDGFILAQYIYPHSDDFGLKAYDQTILQIISDGGPLANRIYEEVNELGGEYDEKVIISDTHHNQSYQ